VQSVSDSDTCYTYQTVQSVSDSDTCCTYQTVQSVSDSDTCYTYQTVQSVSDSDTCSAVQEYLAQVFCPGILFCSSSSACTLFLHLDCQRWLNIVVTMMMVMRIYQHYQCCRCPRY